MFLTRRWPIPIKHHVFRRFSLRRGSKYTASFSHARSVVPPRPGPAKKVKFVAWTKDAVYFPRAWWGKMWTPTRQRFPTENVHKLVVKAMRVGTHIFESRCRGQNTRYISHARFQDNFLDSPPSRSARVASAGAPERTCATQRFIKSDCSLPPLTGSRRYVLRVVCGQETPDASTALQPNSTNRSAMVFSTLRPAGAQNA